MTVKINRRKFVKNIGVTGAALLATPYIIRPDMARAANGVLNILTYDKYIPQDFIDQFQRENAIEVRIRLTDDQGKQYNLLVAEGENPLTDIVTVAGHRYSQFVGSNLLASLEPDQFKNWNRLNPAYREPDWARFNGQLWGIPILAGYEGLARNTDYVGNSDSWEVMFDKKYERMTSYVVSDFLQITMLYLGADGDFTSYIDKPAEAQAATNAARDHLIAHKSMVRKYYDAGSEVQQMLINEDIHMSQSWSGPITRLIFDGHPIELSIPKEGAYGFIYTLNIVNNAPNQANAIKFLDALMEVPEIGATMSRQSGYSSTFDGVADLLSERERRALSLPQNQVERLRFFSTLNRDMKNQMIDRATAEVKAA